MHVYSKYRAGEFGIQGWNWASLLESIDTSKPLFHLQNLQYGSPYITAIIVDVVNPNILYAASTDNNAYAWDLSTTQIKTTFRRHRGPIYDIKQRPIAHHLITGGSDGFVKLWGMNSMLKD